MALISNLKTPDDQTFDIRAGAIPFGEVDSTSTATAFTATVPGITDLVDGTTVMLRNGVVTSASGWTLNINGLGAKPVYTNLAAATRDTTIFNVAYTMLFVYDSDRVSGGCWICYRGYDANTNTIGYQLRTNSTVMNVSDTARYYKMYFMSADNTKWVPASVNSTNNATSARPVNQRPINPFGRIVYTSANTNYAAGANLAATTIWDQYVFNLGYSFNRTGAALAMTVEKPVYLKCAPQADGSAIMDADEPIVQTLPSTADGKIYIYLGVAYSATNIELVINHPVYYHDGTALRLWSGAALSGGAVDSVNGQTGTVVLDATDVGALPDTTAIPTKTSDLTNDSGFVNATQAANAAPVQSVSVTQVQTTGTEIAQVSVNGTSTSLYAPSGGGGTALTDQEIDDAVELAFYFNVAYSGDALSSVSISPSGDKVKAETVVRITNTSSDYPVDITISSPLSVSTRIAIGGYYEFTMPTSDISVTLNLYQVLLYPISYSSDYIKSEYDLRSVSTDGTKTLGEYATSAEEGATITMWFGGRYEPVVTRSDTSAEITCTRTELDTSSGRKTTWVFTMPAVGVTIDSYYND